MFRIFALLIFLLFTNISLGWAASAHLSWTPNTEPDLAGYIVYYGTSTLNYDQAIDVGLTVNYEVLELLEGVTYYFAVTAYDISENNSVFSEEVTFVYGDSIVVVGPPETIIVSPSSVTIKEGNNQQYAAVVKDAQGIQLDDITVNWFSGNTDVAGIDSGGLATGYLAGTAMITASSEGVTSNEVILLVEGVPEPLLTAIEVNPSSLTIQESATQQFSAVAKDTQGNPISGINFFWDSSSSEVAGIDSGGLATGYLAGTAMITASSEGVTSNEAVLLVATATESVTSDPAAMTIEVEPSSVTIQVGENQQFMAVAQDALGAQVRDVNFSWSTSNKDTAMIDSTGLVTGLAMGTATIAASGEGVLSNEALLLVESMLDESGQEDPQVSSIEIKPLSRTITVGGRQQFSAVTKDGRNAQVSGTDLAWNSSNPDAAVIDDSGMAVGFSAGTAVVTASSKGIISNRSALTVSIAQQSSVSGAGCGFIRMKGGRPPNIRQVVLNILILFSPLMIVSLLKWSVKLKRMTPEEWADLFGVWNGLRVAAVSLSVFMAAVMLSEAFTVISKAI